MKVRICVMWSDLCVYGEEGGSRGETWGEGQFQ